MGTLESLTLVTGRTMSQGVALESQRDDPNEWKKACARAELAEEDLANLGVKSGARVTVTSAHGSVVVEVAAAGKGSKPGVVFIPVGPWANALLGTDTRDGIPLYKGLSVQVEGPTSAPIASADVVLGLDPK